MLSISYSPDGSSDSYFQWEVVAPLRGGTGRALQGAMSRCYGAVSLSKLVHGIWGLCWRDFLDFRTSAVWFCSEMFCQNVLGFEMVAWTLLPLRAERCGDIFIFTMSCNATSLVLWAMRP